MIEGCIANQLPMKVNFIDFRAAFDSVYCEYIQQTLKYYDLSAKYINVLRDFYTKTLSTLRVGEILIEWFNVAPGTGQSAAQAPPQTASQGFTLKHRLSSCCPEKHVTDVNYGDDLDILDDNEDGLQQSTNKTLKHDRKAGLQINVKKTKVMSINKNTSQQSFHELVNLNVKIGGETRE